MAVIVNGIEVQVVSCQPEDFNSFQIALLSSSFSAWANQSPSHAATIAANFVARNFDQVRNAYVQLADLYPPTQGQLSEWQEIADQYNIVSLRFLP